MAGIADVGAVYWVILHNNNDAGPLIAKDEQTEVE